MARFRARKLADKVILTVMEIYTAGSGDVEALQLISKSTFLDTFSEQNSAEDIQLFLENNFSLAKLESEMKNPDSTFYFLRQGNELNGYLKLNRGAAQTEHLGDGAMEIERIYIRKQAQGHGLGKALLKKAIEVAIEERSFFLWLGVWEMNHAAIAFYEKHGFSVFGAHSFLLGNDLQRDLLMKLEIDPIASTV